MLLIVGSGGFIGTNLKEYLEFHKIGFKTCSLRAGIPRGIDDDVDTVLFLVGKAHDTKNKAEMDIYNEVNVNLTMRFFEVFKTSKARRFIYVSSIKTVCDDSIKPVEETQEPNPSSVYGLSKLMAEKSLQDAIVNSGKQLIILRPAMVHGPHNKGNLNALFSFVKLRMPYPFSRVKNSRSLLSVENFCFVIKEIYTRDNFKEGVYHLADSRPLSTVDILEQIENTLGTKIVKFQMPNAIKALILGIGKFSGGLITEEKIEKLTGNMVVSNQKIKEELEVEFPVEAKEGLAKTFQSFLNK